MNKFELSELRENAKSNTYKVHGSIDDADCVIGFSFGYRDSDRGVTPGFSNQQLADYIEQHLASLPLVLQFEINDALKSLQPALVIHESRKKGEYLNSREIAEQALIFMKGSNWRKAVIVTHPAMEARNDALCTKLGIITITPPNLEIDYDCGSAQPWTRDKESWWKRESEVIDKCLEENWI